MKPMTDFDILINVALCQLPMHYLRHKSFVAIHYTRYQCLSEPSKEYSQTYLFGHNLRFWCGLQRIWHEI